MRLRDRAVCLLLFGVCCFLWAYFVVSMLPISSAIPTVVRFLFTPEYVPVEKGVVIPPTPSCGNRECTNFFLPLGNREAVSSGTHPLFQLVDLRLEIVPILPFSLSRNFSRVESYRISSIDHNKANFPAVLAESKFKFFNRQTGSLGILEGRDLLLRDLQLGAGLFNSFIQGRSALSVAQLEAVLNFFLGQVHGAGCPIEIVNSLPNLPCRLFAAPLHLSKSATHDGKLATVDTQSTNSYESQEDLNSQRSYFKHSKFFLADFHGWFLLACGYICGFFGHLSLFYSEIRWRWRRRVLWGISAWIVAFWFIVHGYNYLFGLQC
jgi:hypothetical protein